MNDPQPLSPPSRPRRRFWTMSLRGLMILVLIIGGLLGWRVRRASIQQRAVAIVKAAGGEVTYDFQARPGRPFQPGASPPGPRWLREFLGDEYFQEVAWVSFQNSQFSPARVGPAVVEAIADFDRLEQLDIIYVPLDDAAILPLTRISSLQELTLLDVQATGASLVAIRQMPSLKSLSLRVKPGNLPGSAVRSLAGMTQLKDLFLAGMVSTTSNDVAALRTLAGLQTLYLSLSPQEGGWLQDLQGLTQLTTLDVRGTQPSDADLKEVLKLPPLDGLLVDGSKLTNDGLKILGTMTSLTTLGLSSPTGTGHLTDAGLPHLADLNKLVMLWIDAGELTGPGLAQLDHLPISSIMLFGLQPKHKSLLMHVVTRPISSLFLDGPGLTDDWLEAFGPQPGLSQLNLNHTAITDAGLATLASRLTAVVHLSLDGTAITDAGLPSLVNLPTLRSVSLLGTKVTEAGIAALRASRPQMLMSSGPEIPIPSHKTNSTL